LSGQREKREEGGNGKRTFLVKKFYPMLSINMEKIEQITDRIYVDPKIRFGKPYIKEQELL